MLGSPGPARRVRYAEAEFAWELVEKALEDSGFTGARRTRNYYRLVGGEGIFGDGNGVEGRHGGGVVGEGAEGRCVAGVVGMKGRQ